MDLCKLSVHLKIHEMDVNVDHHLVSSLTQKNLSFRSEIHLCLLLLCVYVHFTILMTRILSCLAPELLTCRKCSRLAHVLLFPAVLHTLADI